MVEIIEFIEFCNTASIEIVKEELDKSGIELIFNNGYVTGLCYEGHIVEA